MKNTDSSTVTQASQKAALRLIRSLVTAKATSTDKSFAYLTLRTNEDNPHGGLPGRMAFLADSVTVTRAVLTAILTLGYEIGFAVFVDGRSFEVLAVTEGAE